MNTWFSSCLISRIYSTRRAEKIDGVWVHELDKLRLLSLWHTQVTVNVKEGHTVSNKVSDPRTYDAAFPTRGSAVSGQCQLIAFCVR